jgi:hypothetical protein
MTAAFLIVHRRDCQDKSENRALSSNLKIRLAEHSDFCEHSLLADQSFWIA